MALIRFDVTDLQATEYSQTPLLALRTYLIGKLDGAAGLNPSLGVFADSGKCHYEIDMQSGCGTGERRIKAVERIGKDVSG